jgi:hypothetical protein
VRFRTAAPVGDDVFIIVIAQRRRNGETLGYKSLRGGHGRTRFHIVLRDSARAKLVMIGVQRPLSGFRTTRVPVTS